MVAMTSVATPSQTGRLVPRLLPICFGVGRLGVFNASSLSTRPFSLNIHLLLEV